MPSEKVVWGRMVSGEPFITDDGRQKICNKFAPLTVDMETAGIAHVCYVNGIPFIAIRCVTDTAEHSGCLLYTSIPIGILGGCLFPLL